MIHPFATPKSSHRNLRGAIEQVQLTGSGEWRLAPTSSIDCSAAIGLSDPECERLQQEESDRERLRRAHSQHTSCKDALVRVNFTDQFLSLKTEVGTVETFAGSCLAGFGDGEADSSRLFHPSGVALSITNSHLFVADGRNHRVRAVSLQYGTVSSMVGGGSAGAVEGEHEDGEEGKARFKFPYGLVSARHGLYLFVSDMADHRIRRVTLQTNLNSARAKAVGTVAGMGHAGHRDGPGPRALLSRPAGLALSHDDKILYVADYGNHVIRQIILATGQVSTIAGQVGKMGYMDGPLKHALLGGPVGLAISADSSVLYVADSMNHCVREIRLAYNHAGHIMAFGAANPQHSITTLAGRHRIGGMQIQAPAFFEGALKEPWGLAVTGDGAAMYVTEAHEGRVLALQLDPPPPRGAGRISALAPRPCPEVNGEASLVADGPPGEACFGKLHGLALAYDDSVLLLADHSASRVRALTLAHRSAALPPPPAQVSMVQSSLRAVEGPYPRRSPMHIVVTFDRPVYNFGTSYLQVAGATLVPDSLRVLNPTYPTDFTFAVEAARYGNVSVVLGSNAVLDRDGALLSGWNPPQEGPLVLHYEAPVTAVMRSIHLIGTPFDVTAAITLVAYSCLFVVGAFLAQCCIRRLHKRRQHKKYLAQVELMAETAVSSAMQVVGNTTSGYKYGVLANAFEDIKEI